MTMLRLARAGSNAANDNFMSPRGATRCPRHGRFGAPQSHRKMVGPQTFRIAMRLLLMASFSAVVLLAVSGAFLIGLVLVGLIAAAVASFDFIRRHMPNSVPLWRLDRRVIG